MLFAVLAGSAGGATGNTFCEIETSAVCATMPVQQTAENTCTDPPDTVTLSGTIHVAVFEDENQVRIHTNWQDVAGVGFPSGALYQAKEATRFYTVQRPSGAFTFVLQDERELVSQGTSSSANTSRSPSTTTAPPSRCTASRGAPASRGSGREAALA